MAQKSISIKEIAKMANVSVATVSRVINNNGRFSKETKEKVFFGLLIILTIIVCL